MCVVFSLKIKTYFEFKIYFYEVANIIRADDSYTKIRCTKDR